MKGKRFENYSYEDFIDNKTGKRYNNAFAVELLNAIETLELHHGMPSKRIFIGKVVIHRAFELCAKLEDMNIPDCHKCRNYCTDKSMDYCLYDDEDNEQNYWAFPYEWDYRKGAEECKYYGE